MNDIWSAVGALSAATGTLIILAAAVYAYLQVREAKLARTLNTLMAFHQRYHSEPLRTFRRHLMHGELGDPGQFDDAHTNLLEDVIDQLELLGILVDRKLIDFELVLTVFPYSPPRVWKAAAPHIMAGRKRTPYYGRHLEHLVERYERVSVPVPRAKA